MDSRRWVGPEWSAAAVLEHCELSKQMPRNFSIVYPPHAAARIALASDDDRCDMRGSFRARLPEARHARVAVWRFSGLAASRFCLFSSAAPAPSGFARHAALGWPANDCS